MDSTTEGDFYEQLLNEAPHIPGDNYEEFRDGSNIKWLDEDLLEKGRGFVRRNSFSVMVAQIIATLFGFAYKPFTSVIIRNGKFSERENSYTRNVASERHIVTWYESDILTPAGKGWQDIQHIRKLHMNGLKRTLRVPLKLFADENEGSEMGKLMTALQEDLKDFKTVEVPFHLFTYTPGVYMNQFDLAMVQFVLFGRVALFPETYGINDKTGLDGFIHMWALIGRLMGLHDRFNIALHGDTALFKKLFKNIEIPFIFDSDSTALNMQDIFNSAVNRLYTSGSFKSSLYFGLSGMKSMFPNYTGQHIYELMDWKDKVHVAVLQIILFFVYHFDLARVGMNNLMKFLISQYGKSLKEQKDDPVGSKKKLNFL